MQGKNVFLYGDVKIGEDNVIQDNVIIGSNDRGRVIIGKNAVVRSGTVIYSNVRTGDNFQTGHNVLIRENNVIGNNVSVGSHTIMEGESVVEDDVRIHSHCFIPEFVIIKKKAWLGPRVTILNILHPPCPKFDECAKSVVIEENVKIGGNVTIMPRVNVGKNSLIGAGSVVTKDVPPDSVVVGNPGRVVKNIDGLKCISGHYDTPYEWEKKR